MMVLCHFLCAAPAGSPVGVLRDWREGSLDGMLGTRLAPSATGFSFTRFGWRISCGLTKTTVSMEEATGRRGGEGLREEFSAAAKVAVFSLDAGDVSLACKGADSGIREGEEGLCMG